MGSVLFEALAVIWIAVCDPAQSGRVTLSDLARRLGQTPRCYYYITIRHYLRIILFSLLLYYYY